MGGIIYTLAGGKGGVGRTTTAVNTGIALEQAGHNTVVVDGDVAMTGATELLGLQADSGIHGILAGTDSINDAVVDGPEGLTFVSGDPSLEAFAEVDEAKLGRVVEPLAAAHDIVLVDTPPGLQPLHRDAYERADGTILVTTPEAPALAAAEKASEVVEHVGGDVLGAVVTMADEYAAGDAVDRLDTAPLAVVPEDPTLGSDPIVAGEDGPAATGYDQLAAAIASHADTGSVETVDLPDGTEGRSQDEPEEVAELFEEVEVEAEAEDGQTAETGTLTDIKRRLERETDLGEGAARTGALAIITDRLQQDDDLDDVTVDGDGEALEALFTEEYGADEESTSRLAGVADRLDDTEARERLAGVASQVNPDALRERLQQDDDLEEVSIDDDEDALEALFADDDDQSGSAGRDAGDDDADSDDGGALSSLSDRVGDVGDTDALKDRLSSDDDAADVEVDDDEDALDALFTDDEE